MPIFISQYYKKQAYCVIFKNKYNNAPDGPLSCRIHRVSYIIVDLIDLLLLVSQFTNKSQMSQKFNQLQ